jgi:hypothetical protein
VTDMPYRIRLKNGDFEVEIQGDKEWVENKFKELMTEKVAIAGVVETKTTGLPETLGEFLDQKGNPQKHTDVVAVYAFWLFRVEGMESFNVKDIVSCYDRTRRTKPSNPNMIINQNVATHLFAEALGKKDGYKAWVITRKGEEYVEQMK